MMDRFAVFKVAAGVLHHSFSSFQFPHCYQGDGWFVVTKSPHEVIIWKQDKKKKKIISATKTLRATNLHLSLSPGLRGSFAIDTTSVKVQRHLQVSQTIPKVQKKEIFFFERSRRESSRKLISLNHFQAPMQWQGVDMELGCHQLVSVSVVKQRPESLNQSWTLKNTTRHVLPLFHYSRYLLLKKLMKTGSKIKPPGLQPTAGWGAFCYN